MASVAQTMAKEQAKLAISNSHYQGVCSEYDFYYTSIQLHDAYFAIISKHLTFVPEDTLLDVGAGTGEIAHRLWKAAGFLNPVLCVDPSEGMLKIAGKKEGIETRKATAHEFFKHPPKNVYSKVIMTGCANNYRESPETIFEGVRESLTEDGRCILVEFSENISLPFFKFASESLKKRLDGLPTIVKAMRAQCLNVSVVQDSYKCSISKKVWYDFIRKKIFSTLRDHSDEEIEAGIQELEEDYQAVDTIPIVYEFEVVCISKNE